MALRFGHWTFLLDFFLVLLTLLTFARSLPFPLIPLDDPVYVSANPQVRHGLTWQGVQWAFTTDTDGNWIPMTWLSLMLDSTVFGDRVWGFRLVNILLHAGSVLLLHHLLRTMTGWRWRAVLVAAAFAVHPQRVESVVWIAERKDVLAMPLGLAALACHVRWCCKGRWWWYGLTTVCFTLSLMSKPMWVTLPMLLLVLDVWPLRRMQGGWRLVAWRVAEKLPLLLIAAALAAVVVLVQQAGNNAVAAATLPWSWRLSSAVVAYSHYLALTVWPVRLGVHYAHPGQWPAWDVALGAAVLAAITAAAWLVRKPRPAVLVGWLWFLGTLVPMIGIVQVGSQYMADRYSYLPMVGLLIGAVGAVGEKRGRGGAAALVAVTIVVALGVLTVRQIGYWRDARVLMARSLEISPRSGVLHYSMGLALVQAGDDRAALRHLSKAHRLGPSIMRIVQQMALAHLRLGEKPEALACFEKVARGWSRDRDAQLRAGVIALELGRGELAREMLERATALDPGSFRAWRELGRAELMLGHRAAAAAAWRQALSLRDDEATRRDLMALQQSVP